MAYWVRSRARALAHLCAAAVFAGLVLTSRGAAAVEKQHHIAVAPSLALLKTANSAVAAGAGLGAFYTYGIRDQWNFLGEVSASVHAVDRDLPEGAKTVPLTRPALVARGSVGIAYVIDVLRWVPYAGALLSGAYVSGGTLPAPKFVPNVELAVGLDYQFNRELVAGFAFRQSFFVTLLPTYPSYTNFFLKFEYQWGH
jgi:hypothetical protein